tara:strand:- start:10515 stop:11591 length:1077 start_codon:yes stop_codon:yes gene_type:complete
VPLTNISIKHFRCFESVEISLSPGINFFYGCNGSGKTSMLEAVFIFSSGKSFKSSNPSSLIKHKKDDFYLKGFDSKKGYIVEVEKNQNKPISVKLNNNKIVTSRLIKEFPCTPIHNNTFSFTDAPPDFRRKLLDRSIFIAEQAFSSSWFSFYRTLKQRNALLKDNRISDIYAWNQKLSDEGKVLTDYRKDFFDKTILEFNNLLEILEPNNVFDFFDLISIEFYKGWDSIKSLKETLENNLQKDLQRKTTTQGPHKADIKFLINNEDARQILSRGEQKFFSILWSCAQHEVLKRLYEIEATLIIDDIKSELDERVFGLFVELLKLNKNQVIFSCIEDCFSSKITDKFNEFKKFHVEQLR